MTLHASSPREKSRLDEFESGLKFKYSRGGSLSPASLLAATKLYTSRKAEYELAQALVKRRSAEVKKAVPDMTKQQLNNAEQRKASQTSTPTSYESSDYDAGNWALNEASEETVAENKRLRDLYTLELSSGNRSELSDSERERAKFLVERSSRKKAKRQMMMKFSSDENSEGDESDDDIDTPETSSIIEKSMYIPASATPLQ